VELKPVSHRVPLKAIREKLGHTLAVSPTLEVTLMPRSSAGGEASTKGDRKSGEFCQLICCGKNKGLAGGVQKALANRQQIGCGGLQPSELFGPARQLRDGSSSGLVERTLPRQLAVLGTLSDMEEHGRHCESLEVGRRQRHCVSP